jgi:hypothetical protein
VRTADLIGQLGDPNRLQKCPALFYEFEKKSLNKKIGYKTLRRSWDREKPVEGCRPEVFYATGPPLSLV